MPELSLNAWAEYARPLAPGVEGFLWGNVVYVDDRHTEFNRDPTTIYRKMDAYSVANLRLGVNWNSLELSLYANNLLDDDGVVRALRRPPFDPDAVIRVHPRTVGITLRSYF
ncbi:TonB-dependent receptor [Kineobactrum salinum]|uniref:TonB-dependent receptor n=1 Tax=Kineobactrum salinum TaxID=2708301 RepID=UPI0018D97D1D|nr:TonB-dependent receptor [Kineobactrum salinum]